MVVVRGRREGAALLTECTVSVDARWILSIEVLYNVVSVIYSTVWCTVMYVKRIDFMLFSHHKNKTKQKAPTNKERNFSRWWICLVPWWRYHRCMHSLKCIEIYKWSMCIIFINYTSKSLKIKINQLYNYRDLPIFSTLSLHLSTPLFWRTTISLWNVEMECSADILCFALFLFPVVSFYRKFQQFPP